MTANSPQTELVEQQKERSSPFLWLLLALFIFAILFGCGQLGMLVQNPAASASALSELTSDYSPWEILVFGPINSAGILGQLFDENGLIPTASGGCLLSETGCTPGVPSATPTETTAGVITTPSLSPTPTLTETPTETYTPSITPTPFFSATIADTPTETYTPTPLVYPIKLVNQQSIPPGNFTVEFSIIVINYGSLPPAELTAVIDRLPAGMSYVPGSCSPASCATAGNMVSWNFAPSVSIPQGGFYRLTFQADVSGTVPGDVLTNEVETQGGNFETSVNWKRVYVYTATPTATPAVQPVAVNDNATTNEDVPMDIDVLANDSGLRDVPLTVSVISGPSNGTTAVLGSPGTPASIRIRYSPNPDWRGTDIFQYRVSDSDGEWDTAWVTVDVTPVNDVPNAIRDRVTTNQNTPIVIDVLANDERLGDTPIIVTIQSAPSDGTAVVLPGNQILYTPDLNEHGSDTFRYRVTDSDNPPETSQSDTARVTVDVNYIPVAIDDSYGVYEDDTLVVSDPGVLTNDVDLFLGTMNAILVSDVSDGTLTLNADGSFTYTPDPDFRGADSFSYQVDDGYATSNIAVVTLTIHPQDDPLNAIDDGSPTPITVVEDVSSNIFVLANDIPFGPPTSGLGDIPIDVTIESPPSNGSVAVFGNPNLPSSIYIRYTPDLHYNGPDSFEYRVSDTPYPLLPGEVADTDTATVYLTVTQVNDPPTAVNDSATTNEDTATIPSIDVMANDFDIDSVPPSAGPFWIYSISNPPYGSAALDDNGTPFNLTDDLIRYTPDPDFRGIDSFTYRITDGSLQSSPATVTINVQPVNDTPNAVTDPNGWPPNRILITEDTPAIIDVLANDTGLGDTPLTVTIITPPSHAHGPPTINGDGTITYTPGIDYTGLDAFEYRVTDFAIAPPEIVESSSAFVYLDVIPDNDPPVAVDDTYNTNDDTLLSVPAPGILNNDTDVDNIVPDELSAFLVDDVSFGTLNLNADGSFTYNPELDFYGLDSFTYYASDGFDNSNIATVEITVIQTDDQPDANDDNAFTDQDESINIYVIGNDDNLGDYPLTVTIESNPSNGIATIIETDPWDRWSFYIEYQPAPGFDGIDSFVYRVTDVDGPPDTDTATVNIIINDPPEANDDTVLPNLLEDNSVTIDVVANDTDKEDPGGTPDPTSVVVISGPSHGSTVNHGDGTITYTPDPDYYSDPDPDSFQYRIWDSDGASDTAWVTIQVVPVNDPPAAGDDSAWTEENTSVNISVLTNDDDDIDAPGAPLDPGSVTIVNPPARGVASPQTDGTITFSPNPGEYGTDSFTYTVDDLGIPLPAETSNQATVTITINSPPVANDDPALLIDYTIDEDNSLSVPAPGVLENDTDSDGDPLQATLDNDVNHGVLNLYSNGSFDYSPDPDWHGTDTFTYWAYDGSSYSLSTGTVTITVNSINDTPTAFPDSDSTNEDTPITIDVLANDHMGNNPPPAPGDGVGAVFATDPPNGTVMVNGNNTITYAPDANWNGIDTFQYTVIDTNGDPSSSTVTINVISVNDPPLANPDSGSTDEDSSVVINVWANDTDLEDGMPDPTTVNVTGGGPSHGSVVDNDDGTITYTPNADFLGVGDPPLVDTFTYTINDSGGATSNQATVSVTISPINDPPVANPDSRSTNQVTPVNIDVMANDTDPESNPLSIATFSQGGNGSVTLSDNGTPADPTDDYLTYAPSVGSFTSDSFTYSVQDSLGASSNTATVTITINPPSLNVVKEASPTIAGLGDTIFFFVYVWNDGPGIAYGVTVSDSLGSCFEWDGENPSGAIGDMAVGEAAVRTGRARVVAVSDCGNTNDASADSTNGASDSDSVEITFPPMGGGMMMSMSLLEEPILTPTATFTSTPTLVPTLTDTPTETGTPIPSPIPNPLPFSSPSPIVSGTPTPTLDPSISPTPMPSGSGTALPSGAPTGSHTPKPPGLTPIAEPTPTPTLPTSGGSSPPTAVITQIPTPEGSSPPPPTSGASLPPMSEIPTGTPEPSSPPTSGNGSASSTPGPGTGGGNPTNNPTDANPSLAPMPQNTPPPPPPTEAPPDVNFDSSCSCSDIKAGKCDADLPWIKDNCP